MIGFFIKKAFFDGWDNLIGLVVHNLGYLVVLLAFYGSMSLMGTNLALGLLLLLLSTGLGAFYSAGAARSTWSYSKYERGGFEGFRRGILDSWRHSMVFWLFSFLDGCLLTLVIPFYMSYGNAVGTILAVLLFWVFVALTMALMYFFPLASVMTGDRPMKTLKKCFIIVLDNLGFSLFLAVYSLICLVLSFFLAGLVPGGAGLMLAWQDAVKLLMLKYDYLEEHADADRRHLPWDELLYEERECVGHRTFKNMIFPWKD